MPGKKKEQVDTIEKLAVLMADGFQHVDERLDGIDARLDRVDARLDSMDQRLLHIENELADIRRRLDRLEEQGASQAGFAKEIDLLFQRVAALERRLKIQPA